MSLRAKISKGGKIAIPSICRKQLNLKDGEEVLFDIKDGEITISPLKHKLNKVRELISKYHSPDKSLVDELIAIRREESKNE